MTVLSITKFGKNKKRRKKLEHLNIKLTGTVQSPSNYKSLIILIKSVAGLLPLQVITITFYIFSFSSATTISLNQN